MFGVHYLGYHVISNDRWLEEDGLQVDFPSHLGVSLEDITQKISGFTMVVQLAWQTWLSSFDYLKECDLG